MKEEKFDIRMEFLNKYNEIDLFLESLGFRTGHYWKENSTVNDYLYEEYRKNIDPLYGIEHYIHDVLNLSIRFIRDRNEHRIMFVVDIMGLSDSYSLDEAKDLILNQVRELKNEKLNELNSIKI